MKRFAKLLGLRDGTHLRCIKLSKAETIAMMIDTERLDTRTIANRYGVRIDYVNRLWDRVYDAGGIVGYRIALRRRPTREWKEPTRKAA